MRKPEIISCGCSRSLKVFYIESWNPGVLCSLEFFARQLIIELKISTWPKGFDRLFASRDFFIRNKEDKIIARASTYWLIIDLETKRPKALKEIPPQLLNPDRFAIQRKLEKLSKPIDITFQKQREAVYSDIDLNKHVTSVRYSEWITDTIPGEIMESGRISSYEINHISELFRGDEVGVQVSMEEEKVFLGNVFHAGSGREACRVRLVFD